MFHFLQKRKAKRHIEQSKQAMLDQRAIRLIWASWDVFRQSSGNNWEKWKFSFRPDNIYDFLEMAANAIVQTYNLTKEEREQLKLELCAVGNDFLSYAKQQNLENTLDNQIQFIGEQKNADKTMEVLRQSGAGIPCYLYVIPIVVTKTIPETESTYHLDTSMRQTLKQSLESYYGKGNVYVPRYVVDMDKIETDADRIKDMGRSYFETGTDSILMKFDTQTCLGTEDEIFLIPYVVKRPLEKATFTFSELQEASKHFLSGGVIPKNPEIGDVIKQIFSDANHIQISVTPTIIHCY